MELKNEIKPDLCCQDGCKNDATIQWTKYHRLCASCDEIMPSNRIIKIKYCRSYPNNPNPKTTFDSDLNCEKCNNRFSFWDMLNITHLDTKILCAKCKGIEIKYVD